MQVSWIDADEVRGFIAQLQGPSSKGGLAAPDLQTLPDAGSWFAFDLLTEKARGVQWQPTRTAPAATPAVESGTGPDVSGIREKLRLIRDRAHQAGLLSKEPPARPPEAPAPPAIAPATPPPAPLAAAVAAPAKAPEPAPAREPSVKSTIVERLDEFAQWATKLTTSEETFMLDEHGELLWGAPTRSDLIVCARLALNATMRMHAATLSQPTTAGRMQVDQGRELQLIPCPTRHGPVALALVNPKQVPVASLREALALAMDR